MLETPRVFNVHVPSVDGTCPDGTSGLYRLYDNRPDVNHRYTTSLAVRGQMIGRSWIPDASAHWASRCV